MDEMRERELVLVVSVRCGKGRDTARGGQLFSGTQRCAILELEPRVFCVMKCDHPAQLCTCCVCGCPVHTSRRLAGRFFSPDNRNMSKL